MTTSQLSTLIGGTYSLAAMQDELKTLARRIAASGTDGAFRASRDALLARKLIRRAIARIDPGLTAAARRAEEQSGAAT